MTSPASSSSTFICDGGQNPLNTFITTRKCIPLTEYNRLIRSLQTNTYISSISILGVTRIVVFVLLVLCLISFIVFRRSKYLMYNRLGCAFGFVLFLLLAAMNGLLLVDLIPSRIIDFSPVSNSTSNSTTIGNSTTKSLHYVTSQYDNDWNSPFTHSQQTQQQLNSYFSNHLYNILDQHVVNGLLSQLATNTSTKTNTTTTDYSKVNLRTIPLVKRTAAMWKAQPNELLSESICFIHLGTTSLLHWLMIFCLPVFGFMNFIIRSYLERKKLRLVKYIEKENQKVHQNFLSRLPLDSTDRSNPSMSGAYGGIRPHHQISDLQSFIASSSVASSDTSGPLYRNASHRQHANNHTMTGTTSHLPQTGSRLFGDSFASGISSSNASHYNPNVSQQHHHHHGQHRFQVPRDSTVSRNSILDTYSESAQNSDSDNLSSFGTSFLRQPQPSTSTAVDHRGGVDKDVAHRRNPHRYKDLTYHSNTSQPLERGSQTFSDNMSGAAEEEDLTSSSVIYNGNLSQTVLGLTKANKTTHDSDSLSNTVSNSNNKTTTKFTASMSNASVTHTNEQQLISKFEKRKTVLLLNFIIRHPVLFQFLFSGLTTSAWLGISGVILAITLQVQQVTSCDSIWFITQRVWYGAILVIGALTLLLLTLLDMIINERHSSLKHSEHGGKKKSETTLSKKRLSRFVRFFMNYWWYHDLQFCRREALLYSSMFIIACIGIAVTDVLVFTLRAEDLVMKICILKIVMSVLFELPFVLISPVMTSCFTMKRQFHISRLQSHYIKNHDEYVKKSVRQDQINDNLSFAPSSSSLNGAANRDALIEQMYDFSVYHPTETILRQVLKHSKLNRMFQEFLQREWSIGNLLFYKCVNEYLSLKEMEKTQQAQQKLYHIYYNFIQPRGLRMKKISQTNQQQQTSSEMSHNDSQIEPPLNSSASSSLLNISEWLSPELKSRFTQLMNQIEKSETISNQQSAEIGKIMLELRDEVLFNLLDAYTRFYLECKEFRQIYVEPNLKSLSTLSKKK
ncbi:hypothetical protein C9374_009463 [Naegleria lovaniensis]|uniref:RGS domain-containing protein n=1 Tax=Naegleria lovaniensis TaxID=51637 RepID=A0AA88KQZ1_NAELO|nr:uncharacterized protein C9374_009463 [Naegleria lovaniensis]KAG2392886.1 hypothetical protein C9374_009463 [Naegleria lovaniensis]